MKFMNDEDMNRSLSYEHHKLSEILLWWQTKRLIAKRKKRHFCEEKKKQI